MLVDWPDCPVEGCTNKICLALDSDRCFVHTDGNEHVKRMKIMARNWEGIELPYDRAMIEAAPKVG